jgi:hypothetical protein
MNTTTPLDEDSYLKGQDLCRRGKPYRAVPNIYWSESMREAHRAGYRDALGPLDQQLFDASPGEFSPQAFAEQREAHKFRLEFMSKRLDLPMPS